MPLIKRKTVSPIFRISMQNPKNNLKEISKSEAVGKFGSEEKLSDIDDDDSKCKKSNIKLIRLGPWTIQEDRLVLQLVEENGPQKWTFIANHLQGRIGK